MMHERLPRVRGGKVLYLDYDGVLHPEDVYWSPKTGPFVKASCRYALFQHAPLLIELMEPYPDVRIVLSTTWVRFYGTKRAAGFLPEGLRKRVVGATYHSCMYEHEFAAKPRGKQVYEDFLRRAPERELALDDNDEGWPPKFNVFITHPELGISDPGGMPALKAALENAFGVV